MDSKLRNLTLFAVASIILLIIGMVFYVNRDSGQAVSSNVAVSETSNMQLQGYGPNLTQEQLHAFLRDETFFDPEPGTDVLISGNSTGIPRLYLLASSVEKDIRVTVTDENGEPVRGQSFYVSVDGEGEYKDLDQDGMIYIPELSAGEYYITLNETEGYEVPQEPMRVSVKEELEFRVIEDISFYICSEDEINPEVEDVQTEGIDDSDMDDTELTELITVEEASLGIDVSKWQKDINWAEVAASGVEFAIIRCGYRGSSSGCLVEDPYFVQNIEGAKAAGLEVGVYFFTQAVTTVEAVEEASMVVALCEEYDLDYPVFIDTESTGGNGRADSLDATTRTDIIEAFCKTIESEGYHAGIYASRNWYYNQLEETRIANYVIWVAEYRNEPLYTGNYSIWQYTSSGTIDGINTRVDLNLSYLRTVP